MKNLLFFDTETTGLIESKYLNPQDLTNFPRLTQLSALLYSEIGNLLRTLNFIIKPIDFEILNSNIHGISNEIANSQGVDISTVLTEFKDFCKNANLIICHNYAFDSSIVKSELIRIGENDYISSIPSFCTMTECSPLSNSISLNNLYKSLFNNELINKHNSLDDSRATAQCFFELINRKKLIKNGENYIFNNSNDDNFSFELDKDNTKFYNAYSVIKETKKNIFLTGKAGTGKTTFLKFLRNNLKKRVVTLAFTGVAAVNAGGQTINSFFQLPFRPFLPNDPQLQTNTIFNFLRYTTNKRDIIRSLDILIIDEVSMVRADLIDAIDRILRTFRNKHDIPFGGVQVLFIGDLFQLPPIENDDWNAIRAFYDSPYFFDSKVIKTLINDQTLICTELDKVYRQSEIEFIDILNRIRVGQHTQQDLLKLNSPDNKVDNINKLLSKNYIILSTTNLRVNSLNESKLNEIEFEKFEFEGSVFGDFPDSIKIAPQTLKFKVGAQVMLLKNIGGSNFNGQIGKISKLENDLIEVIFDGNLHSQKIDIATWYKIEYSYNKEKHQIEEIIKGSYSQFPLKLAWAITVHKSQGLTFNKVIADVGNSFASGQVYVALSRATSLNGLKFLSPLPNQAIIVDRRVVNFSNMQTPETTIVNFINEGKADTYYKSFRKHLLEEKVEEAFSDLENGIKFRNDIFSNSFKNFINAYIGKYHTYKKIISVIRETTKEREAEIEGLQEKYSQLQIKYSDFQKKNLIELKKQEKSEQELKIEIEKIRKELAGNEERINSLKIENKRLNQNNIDLSNQVQQINIEFSNLTKKHRETLNILQNLKSKWFVKLFE